MSSYAPTRMRARSTRGAAAAPAPRDRQPRRSVASRRAASRYSATAFEPCADGIAAWARQIAAIRRVRLKPDPARGLSELGIDFFEITFVDQHLARLAAGTG